MNNTIVIIEDELIIAKDLNEILEGEGFQCIYNIITYADAVTTIEKEKPCLVLIDIMLKKTFDGIRIGEYLHKKGNIPFIFITSLYDKNTVLEVKQTAPYGYIVKPFKPADVITNVTLALHNFKLVNIDVNRINAPEVINDVPFQLKKVTDYIHQNVTEKVTLNELVELTRWKKHHFIKLFTQYIHTTPHQYILKCKIDKCIALMNTTDLSVADISFELGFNSYSSFSKLFKKTVGITVEEYKRKIMVNKIRNE